MLQFELRQKNFPGHANTVGGSTVGYVVPILPYLERSDVYKSWTDPTSTLGTRLTPDMEILNCSSNPNWQRGRPSLSYVVNAGRADPAPDATPAQIAAGGICFDLTDGAKLKLQTSLDYIHEHDGTSATLLLTENLQAGSWVVPNADTARLWNTFVWYAAGATGCNKAINCDAQFVGPGRPLGTGPAASLRHARPSSFHKAGASVYFCDNHVTFLSEEIDYDVYKQLMTPNGAASGDPVNKSVRDDDF